MSKRGMTTGEVVEFWIMCVGAYLVMGLITMVFLGAGGVVSADQPLAEFIGMMILWPLFAIKYLCIGIYMVLSAGFGALL